MPTGKDIEQRSASSEIKDRLLCPNCSAGMTYDSGRKVMRCPYCGTTTEPAQEEPSANTLPRHNLLSSPFFNKEKALPKEAPDTSKLNAIHCSKCGGSIAYVPGRDVASCPFCGSPHLTKPSSPGLPPDGMLCNLISKTQAETAIRNWFSTRPGDRKPEMTDLKVESWYVPFWVFEGVAKVHYECKQRSQYDASLVSSCSGDMNLPFKDIAASAVISKARDWDMFFGRWDPSKAVAYKEDSDEPMYIFPYGIALSQAFQVAQQKLLPTIKEAACKEVVGDGVSFSSAKSDFKDVAFRQILLPVWIGRYSLDFGKHEIAVNGITGRIDGDYSGGSGANPLDSWSSQPEDTDEDKSGLILKIVIGTVLGLIIGALGLPGACNSTSSRTDYSVPSRLNQSADPGPVIDSSSVGTSVQTTTGSRHRKRRVPSITVTVTQ